MTYFVGDDSRSTDVAYLRGLAFPTPRWFDGARGLVLPRTDEQALYVLPDRARAELAKRCLDQAINTERTVDPLSGLDLDYELLPMTVAPARHAPRRRGAVRRDGSDRRLGRAGLDRARPDDCRPGRVAGPDATDESRPSVRPARRQPRAALGAGRDNRLPKLVVATRRACGRAGVPGRRRHVAAGPYRLDVGFTLGSGQDRLAESGPWGVAGQAQAQGGPIRLVSRSAPLAPRSSSIKTPLDATFDGVRLLGASLDRDSLRAGERVRLGLFWQNAAGRLDERQVTIALRDAAGAVLCEWHGAPVDGTYPTTDWKPSEAGPGHLGPGAAGAAPGRAV